MSYRFVNMEPLPVARMLLRARASAKLTQEQVARRMGTSQSSVARMESGRKMPSTTSLQKYAKAVGHRVRIRLLKVG